MEFSARNIATYLQGKVEGNPDVIVTTVTKIEEGQSGSLSFLSNLHYEKYIYTTDSSIVLVNNDFVPSQKVKATLIRVEDAYEAFASLLELYQQSMTIPTGIEQPCFIDSTAEISDNVYVGAFSYISKKAKIGKGTRIYPNAYIGENVIIGENCIINTGVRIYHSCLIGNECIIHANTVIGADGFGFAPQKETNFKKIPQTGNVILEDNVEIGANSAIDRATMGSTIIRSGVKLDNLIQIAHNVEIGENTVIAAQSGVSGSTKVGKNCMIGGQVGIAGHLIIADDVKIAAQSGIGNNILEKGITIQGSPAYSIKDYQKSYVIFKKLPELFHKISLLENEIKSLNEKLQDQI
jgi:UDP-3-O-[3-hydroxymyristoyl] glucosamine N-acyltransferase